MSFTIYLGNVSKRINSTMRPDYSGWHSVSAVWKESKDLDSPTFHLYLQDVESPRYNYIYIPSEDAYYWVTGITTLGNKRWEISATMDLLATYRNDILLTRCFVEYGFNQDASGDTFRVQDTRQNISMRPTITTKTVDITAGSIAQLSGTYVLTAVGSNGGVSAYALTHLQLKQLLNHVGTDISDAVSGMTDVQELLQYFTTNSLAQGSAISAIRSCIWLPIAYSKFTGDTKPIYLGDYNAKVNGRELGSNQILTVNTTIEIPWPVTDWKRMNCQLIMYVPFIGTVGIPVDQCNDATTLNIRWCAELITGGVSVRIDAGDYPVYTGSANIGVPYAIGSSNIPIQNAVSGAISTIGGAMQFGAGGVGMGAGIGSFLWGGSEGIAAGAEQMAAGMGNMASGIMQTLTPVVQCTGSLGGSAAVGQTMNAKLCLLYYQPIDDAGFQAVYGHPVMRMASPIAGYCKTRGFSISADARMEEIARINSMLDSGVFIE